MNKLFEKFQGYVSNTPEKIALSSMGDGKTVTYRELDLISGKVYRYLTKGILRRFRSWQLKQSFRLKIIFTVVKHI